MTAVARCGVSDSKRAHRHAGTGLSEQQPVGQLGDGWGGREGRECRCVRLRCRLGLGRERRRSAAEVRTEEGLTTARA